MSLNGWKPISTAPREEGSPILVCTQHSEILVAGWDPKLAEWYSAQDGETTFHGHREPLFWRPEPQAPSDYAICAAIEAMQGVHA